MRKYVILYKDEVSSIKFGDVLEHSEETLRYKLDGSQTFVKFVGETPSWLEGKTIYENEEFISLLNNSDNGWI
tara:strand:- start:2316 stop:2534 length:219 start_codon:yes stop_codon:yes gene_type:complete